MNEKNVQDAILKYCKKLQDSGKPIFYERRQSGGYNYKKGIPDVYAVVNGVHIEIEVKDVGGHQSTMQEKFEDRCKRQFNMLYICADNVEDVKKLIEKYLD